MSEQLIHTTVLLHETVEMLPLAEGKLFVDCTMGGGGHSSLILQSSDAHLIAVDKDEQAFGYAKQKLAPYEDRITFVKSDFKDIKSVLAARGITQIDGAVLDLSLPAKLPEAPVTPFPATMRILAGPAAKSPVRICETRVFAS